MTKAIILASGKGSRFKNETPKQFLEIKGYPVLVHSLRYFQECIEIDEIVVVTIKKYINKTRELINKNNITKVKKIVMGGEVRQESSRIGVECCGEGTKYVLIHDAVRPLITIKLLNKLIKTVKKYNAVVPVIPSSDTIVEIGDKGLIKSIPNRVDMMRIQTPQAFKYELIKQAHEKALRDGVINSPDDSSLLLRIGIPVYTVRGEENNVKITFPTDFQIASKLFELK